MTAIKFVLTRAPSLTLTKRKRVQLEGTGAFRDENQKMAAAHLLGPGEPPHVANMPLYLASDESTVTTGQIMQVDIGALYLDTHPGGTNTTTA
ncbi:MAG: hypothetical protein CMM47_04515 [Rhodospirillaceae bacterium]|nr:hypothetical protein [Rhodospirillaceae bacterium]